MQDVVEDEKLPNLINIPNEDWSQEDYYYYYDTNPEDVLNPASGVLGSNLFILLFLIISCFQTRTTSGHASSESSMMPRAPQSSLPTRRKKAPLLPLRSSRWNKLT